jgi:membrane protein
MSGREAVNLLKDSGVKFWDDRGPRLGAALAYYSALSLSPLLVLLVAITGLVFGEAAARGEIVDQIRDTVGLEAAQVIEQLVAKSSSPTEGIVATVIAGVILLIGATSIFSELQSALNTIWKLPGPEPRSGRFALVRERLLAFALVSGSALLVLVSLVATAVLSGLDTRLAAWLPGRELLIQAANVVLNFLMTAALFAMIFKWLPAVRLSWRDVAIGAGLTAVLFSVGRHLIGYYLGHAAVGSTYGAAGAFVALLVWIYYSTQMLLFGAEFTFVYAQRFGSGVRTADGVPVAPAGRSDAASPAAAQPA